MTTYMHEIEESLEHVGPFPEYHCCEGVMDIIATLDTGQERIRCPKCGREDVIWPPDTEDRL